MTQIQEFFQFAVSQNDMLWTALFEHLQLSLISLVLAVLIAVPLAIFLTRTQKIAEPVIGVAAVLQTIPSLALLGFMILLIGIGTLPAVIALTAYALLPILRNTYTGIKEIDPSIREAATGMGMSPWRRLRKVEIPMAMPVMMAGVRTSMVLIIGTATLAALIGAGGLGYLIMTGINTANQYYILLGAIPAAILALLFDFVLRKTEQMKRPAIGFLTIIIVCIGLLVFPRMMAPPEPDLIVGGKMDAEPEILANMYRHLIEHSTDLTVGVEAGLGQTEFVFNALQNGDIDIYPEFTGTALITFLDGDPEGMDEDEVYELVREEMLSEYDMVFLEPMAFNNTYALALPEETATEYGLESISDLAGYENELEAGFTFEFIDRSDGNVGIQEVYGLDLNVSGMDPGLRIGAVQQGDIDIIDAYSTDANLVEYDMVTLDDDLGLFPPYEGAPLMREDVLEEYPELEEILNVLADQITDDEMQEMNYLVDYEDEDAAEVALQFLQEQGFID